MKKRYWLSALILFAIGGFFYFFVYAYQFTGIMFCALGVLRLVFGVLNMCTSTILKLAFSIALCVGIVAMIATGIWIGTNMGGAEDPEADYAIVLGAAVNDTQPSASLRERLEAALEYAETYPNATLILSGAKGENESISEASCMFTWLLDHGISPDRLRLEEHSANTQENLQHSLAIIEAESGSKPQSVAVISSEYHLLRAELIAKELEVKSLGYPAETKNKLFFCNMFIREIFAVWKELL